MATLVLVVGVATYIIFGYLQVSNEFVQSLSKETRFHNTSQGFSPGKFGFDMAFGFNETLPARIGHWNISYVKTGKSGAMEKGYESKEIFPCENDLFPRNWTCSDAFNSTIKGDFYAPEFWYLEVSLNMCEQNDCANRSEIEAFLHKNDVQVFFTDTYIDSS